jgi:hypothetical protein
MSAGIECVYDNDIVIYTKKERKSVLAYHLSVLFRASNTTRNTSRVNLSIVKFKSKRNSSSTETSDLSFETFKHLK